MNDPRTAGYAGGFDGALPPARRPALIVIDVCDAYLLPGSPLYAPSFVGALPAIERLVATARAAAMPVLHTRVVYRKGGIDGGLFYRKVPALHVFEEGSSLGRPPASIEPLADEAIITKQYASGFFGTSLASTLIAGGIDAVLLCGFSTSGCVRATAVDALQHGFAPFVVREGCADRHSVVHEANLFDLQSKYAEVVALKEAMSFIATWQIAKDV